MKDKNKTEKKFDSIKFMRKAKDIFSKETSTRY
jgi:hypothetical protein